MSKPSDPTPAEVALREAAGFRLIRIDGRPNWVKDSHDPSAAAIEGAV